METNLAGVQQILWAARIDVTAARWHLDNRAVPPLTILAGRMGKSQLDEAVRHTAKAGELLKDANGALAAAIDLIGKCEGLQPSHTTNGSSAEPPRTAASSSA